MRPMRLLGLILPALLGLAVGTTAAGADVATNIAAELTANGVPNPTVSISTPAPATSADYTAFQADPSVPYPSITPYNLLTANPTAPAPVAKITYAPPGPLHPYPGVIPVAGQTGTYTTQAAAYTEDADAPVWNIKVAEAVKHAIAGGASLTGFATFGIPSPMRDTTDPDSYAPTPEPAEYPAASPPQLMTTGAVQVQYQLGMPSQYAGATVSVVDSAGGQRTVTIQFDQAAAAFANDNLDALTNYADTQQADLNDATQGANIGAVIVKSKDPTTATPLFTHTADATWGQEFEWSAPTVKAFTDPATDAASG